VETPVVALVAPSAKAQSAVASDTYQIKRGDTLGAIARKWKPEGVSYEQMLVGLFQTNRPVFIRDNINLIRAGATIFIPGREDVLAIGAADAARQVRAHMAAFSRYRDTALSAGSGSSGISQAQRDVVSRRVGVKKSSRAM
jgi:pilus assembly protein FimV